MISQISGKVRSVVALLTMENNETCAVRVEGEALRQLAELPTGSHVKVTGIMNDSLGVHALSMDANAITES